MSNYVDLPSVGSPSWKNPVATAAALPATGNQPGDARVALDTSIIYVWSGSAWVAAGGGGGGGITSINSDVTAAQTLTIGTAGTDFAIVDAGGGSHVFNLPTASASNRGALSSADWTTFNGKQAAGSYITALTGDGTASGPGSAALTLATVNANVGSFTLSNITVNAKGLVTAASTTAVGNLTDVGTDGITVTGGTGAVIGSGTSLSQHVADTTHNGYLSSTDWNTFNGKQATISIGALNAQAENANGLALVSNVLSAQSADGTHPGMVNTTTQTFAGIKTFSSAPNFSSLSASTALILDGSKNVTTSANIPIASIGITIDGGGVTPSTGVKGYLIVPYACTINSVTLLADQSGSCVIDIWKVAYASFPPTISNTITASDLPTLSSAQKSQDTTLTGWTTSISAGDTLAFNLNSASTLTRIGLTLKVTKT
jgi:hypothetical protein